MAIVTDGERSLRLSGAVEVFEDEDGVFLTTHDEDIKIIVELDGAARRHVRQALRHYGRKRD